MCLHRIKCKFGKRKKKKGTKCSGRERRITVLHIIEHKEGRAEENLVLVYIYIYI